MDVAIERYVLDVLDHLEKGSLLELALVNDVIGVVGKSRGGQSEWRDGMIFLYLYV